MDHLKTTKDRQDRWYAKHIQPRFIPIHELDVQNIYSNNENEASESKQDKSMILTHVDGIPFNFLEKHDSKVKEYLKEQLRTQGFVVVTKALTLEECNLGLGLAWDFIEMASATEMYMTNLNTSKTVDYHSNSSSVKRDDPSTYSNYFPRTVEGGILPFYGSGHSKFMWFLRCHQSILNIFATIHGVKSENLATSLDGMIAWIDPPDDRGWFHLDQNPITKPGFESVQGLVNLLPANEKSGGNVLIPKSHLLFPNHYLKSRVNEQDINTSRHLFYESRLREIDGDDWLEIDQYDREVLDPSNVISCMLGPGDVLIWDSRLVHCSHPPSLKQGNVDNGQCSDASFDTTIFPEQYGFIRIAGLVNMIPHSKLCDRIINQRIEAIDRCRTLTHWVDKVSPLGEENVDEAKKEKSRIEYMKQWHANHGNERENILLSYGDLNKEQRTLI